MQVAQRLQASLYCCIMTSAKILKTCLVHYFGDPSYTKTTNFPTLRILHVQKRHPFLEEPPRIAYWE